MGTTNNTAFPLTGVSSRDTRPAAAHAGERAAAHGDAAAVGAVQCAWHRRGGHAVRGRVHEQAQQRRAALFFARPRARRATIFFVSRRPQFSEGIYSCFWSDGYLSIVRERG